MQRNDLDSNRTVSIALDRINWVIKVAFEISPEHEVELAKTRQARGNEVDGKFAVYLGKYDRDLERGRPHEWNSRKTLLLHQCLKWMLCSKSIIPWVSYTGGCGTRSSCTSIHVKSVTMKPNWFLYLNSTVLRFNFNATFRTECEECE